jgi:hypothetical protein
MLQRCGNVRADVVPARTKSVIDPFVTAHIAAGTQLITDEHPSHRYLSTEYVHDVINHAERYVQANIHTDGIENSGVY